MRQWAGGVQEQGAGFMGKSGDTDGKDTGETADMADNKWYKAEQDLFRSGECDYFIVLVYSTSGCAKSFNIICIAFYIVAH